MMKVNLLNDFRDIPYSPEPRAWPRTWDFVLVYIMGNFLGFILATRFLR